uniref:Uncharacterized protein n=1 Tax=Anguilla anguilla TaxID=7936 RepID=A0A0E9X774_ANGAN
MLLIKEMTQLSSSGCPLRERERICPRVLNMTTCRIKDLWQSVTGFKMWVLPLLCMHVRWKAMT